VRGPVPAERPLYQEGYIRPVSRQITRTPKMGFQRAVSAAPHAAAALRLADRPQTASRVPPPRGSYAGAGREGGVPVDEENSGEWGSEMVDAAGEEGMDTPQTQDSRAVADGAVGDSSVQPEGSVDVVRTGSNVSFRTSWTDTDAWHADDAAALGGDDLPRRSVAPRHATQKELLRAKGGLREHGPNFGARVGETESWWGWGGGRRRSGEFETRP